MTTHAIFRPPAPRNEPIHDYEPGSPERERLQKRVQQMRDERIEIPLVIGGKDVTTGELKQAVMPHDKEHVLADVHQGNAEHVQQAIDAAATAWADWSRWPWEERAAVLLRAAELLAGPWRDTLNAATMLGQSKTAHQAEIDAACEAIDFFRFNVDFMTRIYAEQPVSSPGIWNRLEYRPLEGFVFAVSPFNFTAIGANLTSSPALMGNAVVWKPAGTAMLSAYYLMRLFQEAGLPDGVINLVYGPGATIGDAALASPASGRHPLHRLDVGVQRDVAHRRRRTWSATATTRASSARPAGRTSSSPIPLRTSRRSRPRSCAARSSTRGRSARRRLASTRPSNIWPELRERLQEQVASITMGDVSDFGNFMGAVIDSSAFATQAAAIEEAKASPESDIVVGGGYDDSRGYFVEPTVIETRDPDFRTMRDELFGPVVTTYVYDEKNWDDTLELVDKTAPYALTGAVFSEDRAAAADAQQRLRYTAGNFYVNDKPTGAVVGQQPFGGARASGTNDKAGSMWNLIRWVSPRTIKETFTPPTSYRYPFMDAASDDAGT